MRRAAITLIGVGLLALPAWALYRHSPGVRRVCNAVLVQCRADGAGGENRLTLAPPNLPLPADGVIEIGPARNVVELPGGVTLAELE